jgi:peptidyl-prolyl cis-trans isomerase D
MLLNLMRKHAKSWLIKFLVGIIAAVFIFYFGYSFRTGEANKVASVNGEVITGVDYQKTYRSMLETLQREYRSVWNENLVKLFNVKGRALESLISQKLISQEAARIGFGVTEKEIQEQILSYPAFQTGGRFDESRYRMLLQNNRMTPEDFEAGLERELLQRKIEQFLGTFITVTDQDVLDYYTYSNEKIKIGFVEFLPENYKGAVKVSDEAMEKYFQENQEMYRIPEKIKTAYVVFDPEGLRGSVKIQDRDVQDFYNENNAMFTEEREVKVSQILFKLDEDASEEQESKVREKALSVLKKAREGEDFASLARKHSEDPSKGKGGDLGYLKPGEMVSAVEEAVSKMKKGEISEPVRSPFGYHIVKVEDIKESRLIPFEEAREKVTERLRNQAAADMAHDKALSFLDQMPYQTDLRQFASEHKLSTRESEYFSAGEPIEGIGEEPKLTESLFALQQGEASEVLEVNGKFYIFQVIDRKPSTLPALADVREKVKEDLTEKLAAEEAKADAEKFLGRVKGGEQWDALVKAVKKTARSTEFFSRQSPPSELGYNQAMIEASFGLGEKKTYPDKVYETENGIFVIRYEGSEGIDQAKFEEEKDKYRQSLTRARQRVLMENWLEDLRKRAEVEIFIPAGKEGPEL